MKLFILVLSIITFVFLAFAIKMFFKKNGEFKKSCSSVNPNTGEKFDCSCGGIEDHESCEHFEEHHGVNKTKD